MAADYTIKHRDEFEFIIARLADRAHWATVNRLPFSPHGADVPEL
jgi:hypothetical protein